MADRSRFTFRCHSCGRRQTREVRSGHYVTCGHCGASNPGPKMMADLEESARRRMQSEEDRPSRRRAPVRQRTMVTTSRTAAPASRRAPARTVANRSATRSRSSSSQEEATEDRRPEGVPFWDAVGAVIHGS